MRPGTFKNRAYHASDRHRGDPEKGIPRFLLDLCGIEARDVLIDLPANKRDKARENGYQAMRMIHKMYPDTTAVLRERTSWLSTPCFLPAGNRAEGAGGHFNFRCQRYGLFIPAVVRSDHDLPEPEGDAAQMLLDIIENRQAHPENLLLGSNIIVRGSTMNIVEPERKQR